MIYTDFKKIESNKYQLVYIDPPFEYYGDENKNQAAGKHYQTMSVPDMIEQFDVKRIMQKKAVAAVWAMGPKLEECLQLINGWGLHYRGILKVWVKTTKAGKIINGQGVKPSFVKNTVELLLVASTHPKGRTLPLLTEGQRQVVPAPRGAHSEKPDDVRTDLVELFGLIPRIEVFAREEVIGWDQFGNEVTPYEY